MKHLWAVIPLITFFTVVVRAEGAENQITQATRCSEIRSGGERLACFDRIFPASQKTLHAKIVTQDIWHRAVNTLEDNPAEWIASNENEKGSWIALRALNEETKFANNARPVLLLSCIDNLSRINLALPSQIDDARVEISVGNGRVEYWRNDESGALLSSARGMPAINLMKKMRASQQITVRSNSAYVDGLVFDSRQLGQYLVPLRKRCQW